MLTKVKQIATQLLAGLLSNTHIYATLSDEGARGQQEQNLIVAAIEMAEILIEKVDKKTNNQSDRS